MPRNVRNFWIEVEIDGRTTKLAGGPQSKDGGFVLTIKQRSKGSIIEPLHIQGYAQEDRTLRMTISTDLLDNEGQSTTTHVKTER